MHLQSFSVPQAKPFLRNPLFWEGFLKFIIVLSNKIIKIKRVLTYNYRQRWKKYAVIYEFFADMLNTNVIS